MYDFHGRVALVTGAASGIGLETALQFAACGARVCLADVDSERLSAAAASFDPAAAIWRTADVTRSGDPEATVAACVIRFGRLDFLVNAAGISGIAAPLAEIPQPEWDRTLAINLTGVFAMMRAAIPAMLKGRGGAIVNISSIAGLIAVPHQAPYIASKFGIIGATKAAAADYAAQGIRANVICPGGVRTPMLEQWLAADPDRERFAAAGHPLGRIAQVAEIAGPVIFLCSSYASFITGAVLPVDGGFTLS